MTLHVAIVSAVALHVAIVSAVTLHAIVVSSVFGGPASIII